MDDGPPEDEMIFGLEDAAPRPRKGASANHLLRFRPKPREEQPNRKAGASQQQQQQQQRFKTTTTTTTTPSYGSFETPSLRLLVSDDPENGASSLARDADVPVDWKAVCAVTSSTTSECPICLDQLVAPLSTKCGHVFCAKCVVRHAMMSEFSRSKRCPCCNASLEPVDLRPFAKPALATTTTTTTTTTARRKDDDDDVFALLERPKSSRAAWLFGSSSASSSSAENERASLPRSAAALLSPYSKLTLCDDKTADAVFRATLDTVDDEFAYAIVDAVHSAYVARRGAIFATSRGATTNRRGGRGGQQHQQQRQGSTEKQFVLYGDATGAARYLHPLALRCLLKAVDGDATKLPRLLRWKKRRRRPDEEQRFEVCAEARKRLPWLAHLQLGTNVALCDVDLEDLRGDDDDDDDENWGARAAKARDEDPSLVAAFEARDLRRKKERERSKRLDKKLKKALKEKEKQREEAGGDLPFGYGLRRGNFELKEDDFAPLSSLVEERRPATTEDVALGASPEEPSFAALVARGYAAELGCPALGSSPTDNINNTTRADSARSPLGCWGRPRTTTTTTTTTTTAPTSRPPTAAAPAPTSSPSLLVLGRVQQQPPALPALGDDEFAPPPRDSGDVFAGVLDAALREKQEQAAATDDAVVPSNAPPPSSNRKKKQQRGSTLSLTAGGTRGRY